MLRRAAALLSVLAVATLVFVATSPVAAQAGGRELDVPEDYPTLESAIEAAQPGDTIVLGAGTYPGGVVVPENRPGITIRGVNRTAVAFDGETIRKFAIEIEADDVTLENMSAYSFAENGFYWDGVDGFAGRYLTVWNVGLYGIYAIQSQNGIIERSYVSGAADAAFYIGECNPCNTTVSEVTATLSAVGYSGTNAGGNLVVQNSIFDRNATGILPNSFDVGLEPPPQREATFSGNIVTASGTVPTPRNTPLGGYFGIGIGIVGGSDNSVTDNEVIDSTRYGIVIAPTVDFGTTWRPDGNHVSGNTVAGSGTADLALAVSSGPGNCFDDNTAGTTDPPTLAGCASEPEDFSQAVADVLMRPPPELMEGLPNPPAYTQMEVPAQQPNMPVPLPDPPNVETAVMVGLVALAATIGGIATVYAARPQNIMDPKDRGNIPLRNAGVSILVLGTVGLVLAVLLVLAGGAAPPTPS